MITDLDLDDELLKFVKEHSSSTGGFRPLAYYDKHLDCIRVQFRDCSFAEERKNKIFTVLTANHSGRANDYVGFNIKGVSHLFKTLKLPISGVITLTEIINLIVKNYPDGAAQFIQEKFGRLLTQDKLEIDFGKAVA